MKLVLLNKAEQIDLLNIIEWEMDDYDLKLLALEESKTEENKKMINHLKQLKERAEILKNKIK